MTPPDGFDKVRAIRENATVLPPIGDDDGFAPPTDDGDQGDDPASAAPWLPADFPVIPLGLNGRTCFFLDERGQLQALIWEKLGRANIEGLMGRKPQMLEQEWPRKTLTKAPDGTEFWMITGWRPEDAGRALKAACAEKGIWKPEEKLRGTGAWQGEDGELIIHYGDQVVFYPTDGSKPVSRPPGEIDKFVYSSGSALLQPATKAEPRLGAGAEMLADLQSWNWARPDVDPYLCLGHLVAGVLGGALDWRPMSWITGGRGSGKSTLNKWRKGMIGAWIVSTSDATGAGVWQKLGYDSRPVDIDEAEGEEDNRRINSLLSLARQAASGGIVLRGGQDHTGHEFTARSGFQFSSIGIPPLNSADRSRFAILQLKDLPQGAKPPDIRAKRLQELGRRMLRRVVDQWARFQATWALYAGALERAGHTGRGADVFGTLLACQDLLRFDVLPDSDTLDEWGRRLAIGGLAEMAGDMPVDQECLLHLMTKPLENYRGGLAYSVGEWVRRAAERDLTGHPTDLATGAAPVLELIGLEVKPAPLDKVTRRPKWDGLFLWVPYRHMGLARLFERSKWQGGAQTVGGWVQHLGWLEGAHINVSYWCGVPNKAVLIPIDHCRPTASGSEPHNHSAAGRSPTCGAGDDQTHDASGRQAAETEQMPSFGHPDPQPPPRL